MSSDLCIGTAQFGFDYGITNKYGKVSKNEISKILTIAEDYGINYIDTAQTYGSSEAILGQLTLNNKNFKIVTKLKPHSKDNFTFNDIEEYEESFQISLKNLNFKKIETLLLHSPKDLKLYKSELLKDWLKSLKDRKLVNKLGLSIYSKSDLIDVDNDFLEVVQLPISLYDQRLFHNNTIYKLKKNNSEIYARSIFLQGLLLSDISNWPKWIDNKFKNKHLELVDYITENKIDLLTMSLGFIKSINLIDKVVIGICSTKELNEVLKIWNNKFLDNHNWERWSIKEESFIDPRLWP